MAVDECLYIHRYLKTSCQRDHNQIDVIYSNRMSNIFPFTINTQPPDLLPLPTLTSCGWQCLRADTHTHTHIPQLHSGLKGGEWAEVSLVSWN